MTQGPIEFFLLAFPGTQDHGGVVAALERAQALKDVRIVDALVVAKSPDGLVEAIELREVDAYADLGASLGLRRPADGYRTHDGNTGPDSLIGMNAEDAEEIGAAMELDSTALAMLVEHVWATDLAEAVQEAGGGVVAAVRVPRERLDDDFGFDDDDLGEDEFDDDSLDDEPSDDDLRSGRDEADDGTAGIRLDVEAVVSHP